MSLTSLYQGVKDYFAAKGWDTSIVFGEKEIHNQLNQGPGRANRVVFAPGDQSGNLGGYEGASELGRNPRVLWDRVLSFRVYVWAFDGTAKDDEAVQWRALDELHDATLEALYHAGGRWARAGLTKTMGKSVERPFGKCLVLTMTMPVPVLEDTRPAIAAPITATGQTMLVKPDLTEEQGC